MEHDPVDGHGTWGHSLTKHNVDDVCDAAWISNIRWLGRERIEHIFLPNRFLRFLSVELIEKEDPAVLHLRVFVCNPMPVD